MDYLRPFKVNVYEALIAGGGVVAAAVAVAALVIWRRKIRLRLAPPRPAVVAWALAAAYFAVFTAVTLGRHYSMATCALDLGYYANVIWQFAHGHFFRQTFLPTHGFSQPCTPILVLLAPFAYIFHNPAYLLPLQALFLAAAVVVIYYIARAPGASAWPAVALAASFALSPALHGGNLYDFHPRALGVPVALGAYYFFVTKRFWRGVLCAALVALAREELALHAVALAAWGGFAAGRRRAGLAVAGALAAYFIFCVIVYPKLTYAPDAAPWQNWYCTWHLKYLPLNPDRARPAAGVWGQKFGYVALLLLPAGAFLATAGGALVTVVTPLAVPLLSSLDQTIAVGCQYPLSVLPFIYGAAAVGLRKLCARPPGRARSLALGAASAAAVVLQVVFIGLFFNRYYRPAFGAAVPDAHEKALAGAADRLSRLPADVAVAVDDPFGAHLAHRRYIYVYAYTPGVDLPRAPGAMVLNRRLHTMSDFPGIVKAAVGWKLGLEEVTADYAYFARGRGKYPITKLVETWFGAIEEWRGMPLGGGEVVGDAQAHDGRAVYVRNHWHFQTDPGEFLLPGEYSLVFLVRPANPTSYCHGVFDAEIIPDDPTRKSYRAHLTRDIYGTDGYTSYRLPFKCDERFRLLADVYATAPFYLDAVSVNTDAYERRWGRKLFGREGDVGGKPAPTAERE